MSDSYVSTSRGAVTASGWGWILAYGLLNMVIAVIALLNPLATGILMGVLLIVSPSSPSVLKIGIERVQKLRGYSVQHLADPVELIERRWRSVGIHE